MIASADEIYVMSDPEQLAPDQPVNGDEEMSEGSVSSEDEWDHSSTTTPEVMETQQSDGSGESSNGESHQEEQEEDFSLDEVVHKMLERLQAERSRRRNGAATAKERCGCGGEKERRVRRRR